MKTPEQCESMVDIRAEIDRLDRQVVALLGQRLAYVKAASKSILWTVFLKPLILHVRRARKIKGFRKTVRTNVVN